MSDYNLYFFADVTKNPFQQTSVLAFGVKDSTRYRLTSSFLTKTDTKAYAIFSGTLLVVLQEGSADVDDKYKKVNLILKPNNLKGIRFPVEYIIYRGLRWDSFFARENGSEIVKKEDDASNSELLKAMYVAHRKRTETDPIPLQALYGFNYGDTHIDPTTKIETYFFTQLAMANAQLFDVQGGIELGVFAASPKTSEGKLDENDTAGQGIDIVLKNADFTPTLETARKAYYEITVNGWTPQERYVREEIRHFVDVAAFYGTHFNIQGGIGVKHDNIWIPLAALIDVYILISMFQTKNTLYIDIGNENDYSYNYYENYESTNSTNLRIGVQENSLIERKYETDGWPVLAITKQEVPVSLDTNGHLLLFFALIANKNPIYISFPYYDEEYFSSYMGIDTNGVYTEPVRIQLYHVEENGLNYFATRLKINYIQGYVHGGRNQRSFFPQTDSVDFMFGPVSTNILWADGIPLKWQQSNLNRFYFLATQSRIVANICMQSGLVQENNGERLLYYSSIEKFFEDYLKGSSTTSFPFTGGTADYDGSFLNSYYTQQNPKAAIYTKKYTIDSGVNTRKLVSYQTGGNTAGIENKVLFLGVTKAEIEPLLSSGSAVSSKYHHKLFKFSEKAMLITDDGTNYNRYRLVVAGLNDNMEYQEDNGGSLPVYVYSIDNKIFCSDKYLGNVIPTPELPPFVVNFRRPLDYATHPNFGFDWMLEEYIAESDPVAGRGGICEGIPGVATKWEKQAELKDYYSMRNNNVATSPFPYYVPWLCMYQNHDEKAGRHVFLSLEIANPNPNERTPDVKSLAGYKIRFEVRNNDTEEIDDSIAVVLHEKMREGIPEDNIIHADKATTLPITVKCNKASGHTRSIRAYNDNGQLIGQVNIAKNKDNYNLPIQLVKVNFSGRIYLEKDNNSTTYNFKTSKFNTYLNDRSKHTPGMIISNHPTWISNIKNINNEMLIKKYFHQMLFDYHIKDEIKEIEVNFGFLNLNEKPTDTPITGIEYVKKSVNRIPITQNNQDVQLDVDFNLLGKGLLKIYNNEIVKKEIVIFLMPIFCIDGNYALEGFALSDLKNDGRIVVLTGIPDDVVDFSFLMAHELSHALGLIHSFYDTNEQETPKFVFTEYKTDSILDYIRNVETEDVEKKLGYWQWQIEQVQDENNDLKI